MGPSLRLCLAVDVEGYRLRSVAGQRRAQADLVELLDAGWSGLGAVDRQPKGDGEVAVADADVDPSAALSQLAARLRAGLTSLDDGTDRRLRLRVAAHVGHVEAGANGFVGHAVVRTCRMVESAPLRDALAHRPGAHLALMVSEPVLEDVLSRELHALRPADFRPVDVAEPRKAFAARAWIHVPDLAPGAPTGPPEPTRFHVDIAAGGRVGTVVQVGELHGGLHLHGAPTPGIPTPAELP